MDDLTMEGCDRRNLFAVFSAMAAFAATAGGAAAAPRIGFQTTAQLSKSRVIKYTDLPVRKFPNGGTQRPVMSGTLPTGDFIELHESMLPPGQMPHPPHKHPNEELIILDSGKLEATVKGEWKRVGPGSVIFNASNQMHGVRNVGDVPATYHVINWKSPGLREKAAAAVTSAAP